MDEIDFLIELSGKLKDLRSKTEDKSINETANIHRKINKRLQIKLAQNPQKVRDFIKQNSL